MQRHSRRRLAACAALAAGVALLGSAHGKDPSTTVMNEWPVLMAHDAATTYLDPSGVTRGLVFNWTVTQPVLAGTSGLLNCGIRAFDWRPIVDPVSGSINMHHGPILIPHPMRDAMQEVIRWTAGRAAERAAASTTAEGSAPLQNRSAARDFVVVGVTDCQGDNCTGRVQALFQELGIQAISDCSVLKGLTVEAAMQMAQLPSGGHVLATFDCWQENYDPSVACSGWAHGQKAEGAEAKYSHDDNHDHDDGDDGGGGNSPKMWNCWNTSSTRDVPFGLMRHYLDKVGVPPASRGSGCGSLLGTTSGPVCVAVRTDTRIPSPCAAIAVAVAVACSTAALHGCVLSLSGFIRWFPPITRRSPPVVRRRTASCTLLR
jgi:hypothetical protein